MKDDIGELIYRCTMISR